MPNAMRPMPHLNLKSGIALVALAAGLAMAAPGLAEPIPPGAAAAAKAAAKKPAVKAPAKTASKPANKPANKPVRVTKTFKSDAKVVAGQTMQVVQTGTSPADHAKQNLLPDTGVVACPEGKGVADDAWKDVPEDIRKTAKPGQCFARLIVAPKAETYSEQVMVTPGRTATRTVPAEVEWVVKDVLVRKGGVVRKSVPAVTHTEVVTEVVREAGVREEIIPARYETRTERVQVQPAHQEWVKTRAIATNAPMLTPDGRPVHADERGRLTWPGKTPQDVPETDEARQYLKDGNPPFVWCLKDFPAVYETRKTRVEVAPATTRRVEIPAVTRRVTKVVVDSPAHVEEVPQPDVYEKRKVRTEINPARTETYTIAPVYRDVQKTRLVGKADAVWREVICTRNAKPETVRAIQKSLAVMGYYHGKVDGYLGTQTVAAMQKYQADQNLPQGQVSVEAVQMMGIPVN